jgi:lysophospholipase L1-like esterase
MTIDPRLSRVAAIAAGPVLLVQGRRLKREIPRLPDAVGPWHGEFAGPDPIRLLVLGDSTAAGVGAPTQDDALPGNLARELGSRWGRGVRWRAIGETGATARDLVQRYLAEAASEQWDVVFLSIGSNDAQALRSRAAFRHDVRVILRRLRASSPHAVMIVSSLPAFFRFAALPNPVRFNLYLHAQNLEQGARRMVRDEPGVVMSPPPPPYTDGFFASDGFHPSAQGYRDWVRFAVDDALAALGAADSLAVPDSLAVRP